MQSSPSVRRATPHAGGILRCLADAFAPYRDRYTPAAFVDTVLSPESLNERMKTMTVFVALDQQGSVVGTVACSKIGLNEGHVRGMAVRPKREGAGVAQKLLERVESELRKQKCARITLDTTEPLERAMRFYKRNGYRPSGKVTDFFGMRLIEYVKP